MEVHIYFPVALSGVLGVFFLAFIWKAILEYWPF